VKKTANLVPKESGAMNEAFSDIWGALTHYAAPGKSTWLIGEDIERSGARSRRQKIDNSSVTGRRLHP
jgi:Zn-dependent metalloprotease